MPGPIVTLTTDFGEGSPYVAEMKGVLLSLCDDVRIIDITHAVPPQDIRQGALILEQTTRHFPAGSIHVAVIDPGVGTSRKVVYARIEDRRYIAPDNGLLGLLARRHAPTELVALTNPTWWREPVSKTFHGRDIMAPAAAHLAGGVDPQTLGEPLAALATLDWPEPVVKADSLDGIVCSIDAFGNLITNIEADLLAERNLLDGLCVTYRGRRIRGPKPTYGAAAPGELIALLGSNGRLEIAEVNGSAQAALGAQIGDALVLCRDVDSGWRGQAR